MFEILEPGDAAPLVVAEGAPERGRVLIGRYVKPPELREQVADGLAKAGVTLQP